MAVNPKRLCVIQKMPTHRCKECGAFWRFNRKEETGYYIDSWNLVSRKAGQCCDNVAMGSQIAVLSVGDAEEYINQLRDDMESQ